MSDEACVGWERARLELIGIRTLWFEAKALQAACSKAAADHVRSGNPGVPATTDMGLSVARMLIAMETRAARLVLKVTGVAFPGGVLPLDGFDPVAIDLGHGWSLRVEPAVPISEHPRGGGLRRVSFT